MRLVILAGGSGTRLWPLSRSFFPKQFLALTGECSLLHATLERVSSLSSVAPIIICNEKHRFIAAEQVRQAGIKCEIMLEPYGRNTAPAIALSALEAIKTGEDPLLLVLAADHFIRDAQSFRSVVKKAEILAEEGNLVTFGVTATHPETGYGYIRRGDQEGIGFRIAEFVEKPKFKDASDYVASDEYYWNSGMFLFKASRYLEELGKHRPDILAVCEQSFDLALQDMDFLRLDTETFEACPNESIDYAVMEKTDNAMVVPLNTDWSDVGSWSSVWEIADKDANDNVLLGDVVALDTSNCLVQSTSKLVATIGLKDVVVIETKDAVLVSDKNQVQNVKKLVDQLNVLGRSEHELHREVYRPWGKYDSIDVGDRYQVKRITVKPGAKLSVQMHHHRAEHWIVVSGTAMVRRDDEEFLMTENESVYLPVGVTHSLQNPGKIPLELIEVQSGAYLGEDDIIRFEDLYGRVKT